ncbi:MAG: hypothetical protein ACE5JX_21425 [Acidobacteriota bacterium]
MLDLHQQRPSNRAPRGSMRSTSAKVAGWIAVGGLYLGLILIYAWNHSQILDLQYEIEASRIENQELRDAKDALRAELKLLTRPERIISEARQRGLISANRPEVMVIEGDLASPRTDALRAEAQLQSVLLDE